MSDPNSINAPRQPTPQDLHNIQLPPQRRQVINIISFAFIGAAVIIAALGVWFFMSENENLAYVLWLVAVLELVFVLPYMRKLLTKQAKLQVWNEDPLNH